ncbi:MAG: Holliday junction resolvase-like protein [Nitrososphaeria archaeon]
MFEDLAPFLILLILVVSIAFIILYIKYVDLKGKIPIIAKKMFDEWREKEIENIKNIAKEEALTDLKKWKLEEEEKIREDAIEKSASTILGKVGEQLAPLILFPKYGISFKDLRFLGSPIDYIAFKGLEEGNPEKIVFIEIKSGRSDNLTQREAGIKSLVDSKKVEWLTLHLSKEISSIMKTAEG